ncbi:hypothetical protein IBT49_27140 [Erwinia sp. S63]|uniref:hypothetical protein n=1 Tax=Erwinia sp. S63 TaxID=2769341 RepID=UPI00190D8098|nr:hypothetical protein [Erwinia sp. S63]MBK0099671.1 hypothetical protein [Erwinia sp. S63]
MIKINHEFSIFLDISRYERIVRNNDLISTVLNLALIMENFINIYIKEVSPKEFHDIFLDKKQKQHFKLGVAKSLGLPRTLADAITKLSGIRNNFAHKLDYELKDEEILEFEQCVEKITAKEICRSDALNYKEVDCFLSSGVKVKGSDDYTSNKVIGRLVNSTYMLANKAAFFSIDEFNRRGILSLG